ncbi:ABC transporter substrate-binding protein [Phytohabitans flavus]|nr:ABC transporter substrate-binding protein [Phytohabitans flavus]
MSNRRLLRLTAGFSLAVTALAACSESTAPDSAAPGGAVSGDVSVMAVWTGEERAAFQAVLDGFTRDHPGVRVTYTSAGNNLPTVLGTAVEGGDPPDLAVVPQPALVTQFRERGALKPLDFLRAGVEADFPPDIARIGVADGHMYSFVFKAANKSTLWYNVAAFEDAGVKPPGTWDELIAAAGTLKAAGTPAYAIAGADGWTLTDLFENIYLRQAGPEKYDQLAAHEIPWTDPSVVAALRTMTQVLGDSANIAGGTTGALQTDLPTASAKVLSDKPSAAVVIEGDFVPTAIADNPAVKGGEHYAVVPFPSIGGSDPATVVGGGDSVVMFADSPASRALATYLTTPAAARIWAERGGFSSPNRQLPGDAYPDELARTTANAVANAKTFRFDMSDLAPVAFGGTAGQGEFKLLQDLLANPSDVDGTAKRLEAAAAAAYGG